VDSDEVTMVAGAGLLRRANKLNTNTTPIATTTNPKIETNALYFIRTPYQNDVVNRYALEFRLR
jgi:hypothetical protein